jgi:choice-of-anchor B domain-containing protein
MRLFTSLIFICYGLIAFAQQSLNVDLFAQFHRGDNRYSGSWSYVDSMGNEYGLVGARTGTAAYSIDNSNSPELGFVSGPHSNWREITVIGHHAYVSTEGSSDSTGMQVIDLQYLPDSLHLVTTYSTTFTRGHILQRDVYSEAPYVYVNGTTSTQGVHILDVSDPANPEEIGLYVPGYYIHDCFVKENLLFAAAFYEGKLDIVDISDRTNPQLITQIDHIDGNTHSSWLTEDNKYLMVTSELDGKPARIYNVEDLSNITEVSSYTANSLSLVHNPYIVGDFAFISHNTEGLRVVDLADPELPVEVGYYDTFAGPSGGFSGLWSACPFFPSGKIIGGNRTDGLYVWTFNETAAGRAYAVVRDSLTGELLSNIEVSLPQTSQTLTTDFNGIARFGAVPGNYTFDFNVTGYLPKTVDFNLNEGDSLALEIVLQPESSAGLFDITSTLPNLMIVPNPAINICSVDLQAFPSTGSIQLYDQLGQLVETYQLDSPVASFTLMHNMRKKGLYFIQLLDKDQKPLAIGKVVWEAN